MSEQRHRSDFLGGFVGIVVFLGGIVLLLVTFQFAYTMFEIPPDRALRINEGEAVDLAVAGQSFAGLIVRVLLLLVMAFIGAMIATRGIKMYADTRFPGVAPKKEDAR